MLLKNIAKDIPTEKVKEMKSRDLNDDEILRALKPDYSNQDINDAFNQAGQEIPNDNILNDLDQFQQTPSYDNESPEELLEEAPVPESNEIQRSNYPSYEVQPSLSTDQIQQVVESVVEEKWDELTTKMGDFNLWKENVNNDLESLKQEVLRTQERFNNLQVALVGKVSDYNKNILEIGSEMKALEQVFKNILEPLSSNVKELGRI